MKATEFAAKATEIAKNYKTSYIWGGFGMPITESTLQRAAGQYTKNTAKGYVKAARRFLNNGFYFDCVGLIKAILWGWNGDSSKVYGGGVYASNGVPDIDANAMLNKCSGISTDFSKIQVGEVVWMQGHIGIYIGDGLAVECTPSWNNGVQITAVGNIGVKSGYNTRIWTKHGKLPYVTYEAAASVSHAASVKVDAARAFAKKYAKTYTVTSDLNLRTGANTSKKIIRVMKKGETVTCYGYYTMNGARPWLLVKDKNGATGFCSTLYLK